jgi:adenosylhomocysteinase
VTGSEGTRSRSSDSRIQWVIESCRLLAAIGDEFETTKPFDGLRIGTGIHLEPKTAALLLTLKRGGADVIATGNLNSTQPSTVQFLESRGITVLGDPTADAEMHDGGLRGVLDSQPALLLDNGGDLFVRYLERPYPGLIGGTEETTSGRARLTPLRRQLGVPVLVINDSPIKQFAENEHAVGQSVLESYFRITNRSTQGKHIVVFGYGSVGRGVAANFRNAFALVTVIEADPVKRLQASFDGFSVADRDDALSTADLVVTVTGARNVVTAADLATIGDDTVLMNAGHFPAEIDVASMLAHSSVERTIAATEGLETLVMTDGRRIHLAGHGHMVNLAGPRPLGNSIESMDLGFALQCRCLEAIATGSVAAGSIVVPVPRMIDELVARSYLELVAGVTPL